MTFPPSKPGKKKSQACIKYINYTPVIKHIKNIWDSFICTDVFATIINKVDPSIQKLQFLALRSEQIILSPLSISLLS